MLAEGGGRSGKHQPLQVVSDSEDEDDDECSGVSDRSGRRSKEGGKEPWWKFWKRSDPKKSGAAGESSPLLKEPSPGPSGLSEPSTSAAGSEGFDNAASGAHPPGGWVEHTTEVLVGELNSSHYEKVKRPYHYPKLGTGQRFQRLRQVLQKVEEVASGLCFLHSGPYASAFLTVADFRRDTACVTEEAVVLLLDDMEKNGIPNGETATLAFVLEKPSSVPCSGKIMFEVYATTGQAAGLEGEQSKKQ
ncbi:uncharacterized protein EMH_0051810 [Eimeria mitis]|uniref:Uncharacterized protein n=1 Tax=Eimeria mitis TaxID=44415 RepID=U6JW97_9EIME|nr:uncharacterized protein EMH_0051810 [Eimeria mitis]CDJ29689.1 hypothetical protein EMH_0051810 [Eimeria mitis]